MVSAGARWMSSVLISRSEPCFVNCFVNSSQLTQADRYTTGYLGAEADRVPERAAAANPMTYSRPPTLDDVTGQVINSACLTQSPTEQIAPCVGGS